MAGKRVLVTGGGKSAGLAAVKALSSGGQRATATANDAADALAIRLAGGLPVFPDLRRASEVASALKYADADAILHCAPQATLGLPQVETDPCASANALAETQAVAQAAAEQGVSRVVMLSAANPEADTNAAEAALRESGVNGFVLRAGYVYGGKSCATSALADMIKGSQRIPSGDNRSSYIHEEDLAAAMLALLATEAGEGVATLHCADDTPIRPDDFAIALAAALGLSAPRFATPGLFAMLRAKSRRDHLLSRENIADSRELRVLANWSPRHATIESGLDATALTWRLDDAVRSADYYEVYEDAAAKAIAARESGIGLPEPVVEEEEPAVAEVVAEAAPAPVQAAAPPPSDGPTPWNEDEAKREERRRKALERKAKRAAKRAGG